MALNFLRLLHSRMKSCVKTFHLSASMWDTIRPLDGTKRLKGQWAQVIAAELGKLFPSCPFVFRRNFVRKIHTRKPQAMFIRITASCKFRGAIIANFIWLSDISCSLQTAMQHLKLAERPRLPTVNWRWLLSALEMLFIPKDCSVAGRFEGRYVSCIPSGLYNNIHVMITAF